MTDSPTRPRTQPHSSAICPHLGLEEDAQTCLAYPSHWNLCHRCRPAAAVRLRHQRKVCLVSAHRTCPVFQRDPALPLPPELDARQDLAA